MKQTAPQYIKSQGLPSLVYVAKAVNKDPRTIYKWYRDNFALFEAVVAGVRVKILPHIPHEAKPVAWCDEDGIIISEYESAGQAARYTNNHRNSILRCCKGVAELAGNARWKYIDSFNKSGNIINLRYETWLYERDKE